MKPMAEGLVTKYEGPCVVSVPMGEWRGFRAHKPGWWPSRFEAPNRDVVERVERGLRRLRTT
jgi:hypothetical protein